MTVTPPQDPFPGPSPDALLNRRTLLQTAGIAFVSALLGVAGTVAVSLGLLKPPAAAGPTTLAPVAIKNFEVQWLGNGDGRYEAKGQVVNGAPGQAVWTFTQPLAGGPGPLYPNFGPCPIGDGGNFDCELGYAGRLPDDAGKPFAMWAAVVAPDQAYDATLVKSNYTGRSSYPTAVAVPHVPGDATLVSVQRVHPTG